MGWLIVVALILFICFVAGGFRTWGSAMQRKRKSIFCVMRFGCKPLPANHFDYGHCRRCGHKPK
jgi:hypothetical protein